MSEADARRNNLLKEKVVVLEFKINKLGKSHNFNKLIKVSFNLKNEYFENNFENCVSNVDYTCAITYYEGNGKSFIDLVCWNWLFICYVCIIFCIKKVLE